MVYNNLYTQQWVGVGETGCSKKRKWCGSEHAVWTFSKHAASTTARLKKSQVPINCFRKSLKMGSNGLVKKLKVWDLNEEDHRRSPYYMVDYYKSLTKRENIRAPGMVLQLHPSCGWGQLEGFKDVESTFKEFNLGNNKLATVNYSDWKVGVGYKEREGIDFDYTARNLLDLYQEIKGNLSGGYEVPGDTMEAVDDFYKERLGFVGGHKEARLICQTTYIYNRDEANLGTLNPWGWGAKTAADFMEEGTLGTHGELFFGEEGHATPLHVDGFNLDSALSMISGVKVCTLFEKGKKWV